MTSATCELEDCDQLRYQKRPMCASHYMKQWRYGDPHHKAPRKGVDLTGRRFGSLVADVLDDPSHWWCACDCGARTRVRTWSLTSGGTTTCGDSRIHVRREDFVLYHGAHDRIYADRGPASAHLCVDCGAQARHWSYDHDDPDQLVSARGWAYSLDPGHYQPRCVPCHRAFDNDNRKAKS